MPASTSKGKERELAAPPVEAEGVPGERAAGADRTPAKPRRSRPPARAPRRGTSVSRADTSPSPLPPDPPLRPAATSDAPGAASQAAAPGTPVDRTGERPWRAGDRGRRRGPRPPRPAESGPRRLVDTPGPEPGTPLADVKLVVGTVAGAHGLRGELKVALATDDPEHLATVKRLWLGDEPRPRKLLGVRFHAGQALIRLGGIATPEAAREYRGQRLRMAGADARPLPPGEYRLYQLVGLEAVTEAGESLGTVTDVLETGANDVFVIGPAAGGQDLLLPYHPDVILEISPEQGRMLVRPLRYYDEAVRD